MEKLEFRLLDKEEIECRVQQVMKDNSGCILLLYKTARTDYNLLDEVVGTMNWKCDYKEIKGNLYCEISIYNKDLQQWISKSNCGVESNTEAEKGEASDSLKRAGFVWGIGRELYTAPFTYIKLTSDDFSNSKLKTQFKVKEIGYTNRAITKLIIEDNKGNVRFTYGNTEKVEKKNFQIEEKEIITKEEKTPKKAQEIVNDSDLPFDLEMDDRDIKQEKANMQILERLRETIVSKLYQLGYEDLPKAMSYYAKKFNKETFEDLKSDELATIIDKLDATIKQRKEA